MILAGDIGGTNSRLAIFDLDLREMHQQVIKNAGRASLVEVVLEFVGNAPTGLSNLIDRACFGVAGPVAEGKVTLTNLQWQLDEVSLADDLAVPTVALINDLVAHAEGIEVLKPEHLLTIKAGEPAAHGNRAVIAAGTGLGEAGLVFDPDLNGYRAFASEGGHADFAPRNDDDIALMKYVQQRKGMATWERVLSGPGLRRIYDFLLTDAQMGRAAGIANNDDPTPQQVSEAATSRASKAAYEAGVRFVRYYGMEAGNLALKLLATGGVYLSGAVAYSHIDQLKSAVFLDAFHDHGPDKLRPVLEKIPIHVVTFEMCALYGAANYARRIRR